MTYVVAYAADRLHVRWLVDREALGLAEPSIVKRFRVDPEGETKRT